MYSLGIKYSLYSDFFFLVRNCIYSIVFGKEMQFNKHYIIRSC